MAGRQSLDILFNIVIFLVNFLNFTSTAPHTQPQKRISSSKANSHSSCPPPAPNSSATSPFLLNSEAAIYYVAAAVTILICLANFLLVWVPKKSMALRNV
jgi:hypothetical protein